MIGVHGSSQVLEIDDDRIIPLSQTFSDENSCCVLVDNYVEKRKIDFTSLSEEKKKNKIKSIFDKDINFKNLILGLIVGHFSVDEYLYYTQNPSEFNKRVLQMIIQRLQNSISEFKI